MAKLKIGLIVAFVAGALSAVTWWWGDLDSSVAGAQLFNTDCGVLYKEERDPVGDFFELPVRRFRAAHSAEEKEEKGNHFYRCNKRKFALEKSALVLIDTWDYHPNSFFEKRMKAHIKSELLPVVEKARSLGVQIVYLPHRRAIAKELSPEENDVVIENHSDEEVPLAEFDKRDLKKFLDEKGIKHLFYAGYASNYCVFGRPGGLVGMNKMGFDTVLLRDASIAVETEESVEGEWHHRGIVSIVESGYGGSVSNDDFMAALDELARND